jgi:uncharacterized protein
MQLTLETRILQIRVKPNSRERLLEPVADGVWLAKLKSQPIDGKANQELITLVARHFQCAKAQVVIKSGASGRLKWVQIVG